MNLLGGALIVAFFVYLGCRISKKQVDKDIEKYEVELNTPSILDKDKMLMSSVEFNPSLSSYRKGYIITNGKSAKQLFTVEKTIDYSQRIDDAIAFLSYIEKQLISSNTDNSYVDIFIPNCLMMGIDCNKMLNVFLKTFEEEYGGNIETSENIINDGFTIRFDSESVKKYQKRLGKNNE